MARRARKTIKWEYKPGWRYVRERLMDPRFCAKGSYRTLSSRSVPTIPEGVLIVTCCKRGQRRNARGQCCSRSSCHSSATQAIRHSVDRFRFHHKDVWKALQTVKPGAGGVRVVWAGKGAGRKRRTA